MDQQNLSAPSCAQVSLSTRQIIAAGIIRRTAARTFTVRVTAAGVTGVITPTLGAPTCHGPMRRDGEQWVCPRCGAWTDPGIAPGAQTFDDDSDDVCPICECWVCTCGSSRAASTPTCPRCRLIFEACTCTGVTALALAGERR
ncbi:hypothetical protein ABTX35_01905 [Streptomyces sp. NPDC096080]|uniref:hypothetical protein n=1 Tax=Streptomyces sp. NPDC096080 TaxID=3156693 RepID=UPI00331C88B7